MKQDYGAARGCYEDAARNGHPSAQCSLGVLDLRGLAGRIDWISAAYWFLKAASTYKHRDAIHNLQWIIDRRDALPVDTANMIGPYRDSAFGGEVDAQYLLGWCYEYSIGVPASVYNATLWYKRAMQRGHVSAPTALHRLADRESGGL